MLKESHDLVILGMTFDAKMTFEEHLRSVSSDEAQRTIMKKSWQVFHDRSHLLRSFWIFVLPVCIVVCGAGFSAGGVLECQMAHRRSEQCCACHLRLRAVHCLCHMCRRVLLVVLWLLIGTRFCLLAEELLSTVVPLCQSQRFFGTILVTLYLLCGTGGF